MNLNSKMAQALKDAGIITEENRVVNTIRRHKPNRRPTQAQKREKLKREAIANKAA